jgi:glyoxylase-like metal-dependent hydrolase (beta-lactamase superfamily II)
MILERTESPQWTSNAYLLADRDGGTGVLVDGNGELRPLLDTARERDITIAAILITHWHADHVAGVAQARDELGGVPVLAHAFTKTALEDDLAVDRTIGEGDRLTFGDLTIEVLETPGHTAGQLSLLVDGTDVLTADVLFKGTVGGTFAPGNTGYADHRASVLRLLDLPPATRVHPGHTEPTTVADERADNPFFRIWNGDDPEGTEEVTVWDRAATLVLWAPDYDGSNKAWVRFHDTGEDGIVGGSQVVRG